MNFVSIVLQRESVSARGKIVMTDLSIPECSKCHQPIYACTCESTEYEEEDLHWLFMDDRMMEGPVDDEEIN